MNSPLFFDHASTTKCCEEAIELIKHYALNEYGNPSSAHSLGSRAAKPLREAREFFGETFQVDPEQVIFTGSGTESDNLAITGTLLGHLDHFKINQSSLEHTLDLRPQVLTTAIEHSAVSKTIQNLSFFGVRSETLPVNQEGQISLDTLDRALSSSTVLVSFQQVNHLLGTVLPVQSLATRIKEKAPQIVFHTDAIQAFGKIEVPHSSSSIDLVSISSHKIQGPKGIGALIVLNPKLLKSGLRPLVFGGDQEGGFRSGTQSPGLIAGFHRAAQKALENQNKNFAQVEKLRNRFKALIREKNLTSELQWNSPAEALPHIISLSAPGTPASTLANLLEQEGCLISVGSACRSRQKDPDPVLQAFGLPLHVQHSTFRISFSHLNSEEEVDLLANALERTLNRMKLLTRRKIPSRVPLNRN